MIARHRFGSRRSRARNRLLQRARPSLRFGAWALRLAIGIGAGVALWAAANWAFQSLRKPTEFLAPLSAALAKTPSQTWHEYGPLFREHATATITAEFLAALAQVEGSGNPLARTYWRWRPNWHPFELYRPASSALGMYQITDATLAQTRGECGQTPAHGAAGPKGEAEWCWFDGLYSRVEPSHAIALTSARLDRAVAKALKRARIPAATQTQKLDLAAVIHLCGAAAGEAHARRRLRLAPGQRCGDHDVRAYLERINRMKGEFDRLARSSRPARLRRPANVAPRPWRGVPSS